MTQLEFGEQYKITFINDEGKKDCEFVELRKFNKRKSQKYGFLKLIYTWKRYTCFVNENINELRYGYGGLAKKILKIEKLKQKTKPIQVLNVEKLLSLDENERIEEYNECVKKLNKLL